MKVYITPICAKEQIECAQEIIRLLDSLGCQPIITEEYSDGAFVLAQRASDAEQAVHLCDVIIALGGDGTILRAAKQGAEQSKPVLGINLGHLGFMSGLERAELDFLRCLPAGEYTLDERMMLDVEVLDTNGNVREKCNALNDAVLSRGSLSQIVSMTVELEGNSRIEYRADGLIFATPTGSTAYSLSAGGPVVDSSIDCIVMTPICAHSLLARPIIFAPDTALCASGEVTRWRRLYLTVDGQEPVELEQGERVRITRSDVKATLIRIRNEKFYDILKTKFM